MNLLETWTQSPHYSSRFSHSLLCQGSSQSAYFARYGTTSPEWPRPYHVRATCVIQENTLNTCLWEVQRIAGALDSWQGNAQWMLACPKTSIAQSGEKPTSINTYKEQRYWTWRNFYPTIVHFEYGRYTRLWCVSMATSFHPLASQRKIVTTASLLTGSDVRVRALISSGRQILWIGFKHGGKKK